MFDKLNIVNDHIRLMKYEVIWTETQKKRNELKELEEVDVVRSELLEDTAGLIEILKRREIEYQVNQIDIPEEILKFDGLEWTKGRDEALLYINGDKKYKIMELKNELVKVKEDIEQVDLFGMVRDDIAQKRARAAEIINSLRELEGKEARSTTKE